MSMSKEERCLSVNVNGQSKVPPGFRFHPTEEELLHYYLRKKVGHEQIDLDVIPEVDLNKLEPWDIQEKCNIGSSQQNDWYFFSHKDRKYPTGTRTNRATASGFWKATGRDKVIHCSLRKIGMRKTLVFYKGRAPHGQKSEWIMHEYRLDDIIMPTQDSNTSRLGDCTHEEGWVVCRVFKKKHYHKSFDIPQRSVSIDTQLSNKDDVLEQLLMYMDGTDQSCKQFMNPITDFTPLPGLDTSPMTAHASPRKSSTPFDQGSGIKNYNPLCVGFDQCSNWADVDKFVASQLDGQMEETKVHLLSGYGECNEPVFCRANEEDIWGIARSTFDPLNHLSV